MAPPDKPTTRQLRYLRRLAEPTGTTFTPPATRRQASQEIERLKLRPSSSRLERREDSRSVSQGLASEQPASSVRDDEIRCFDQSRETVRPRLAA
jgi:hypothetical protein